MKKVLVGCKVDEYGCRERGRIELDLPKVNPLSGIADYIGCRCVDLVQTDIDGTVYDIWVDDDGLLVDRLIPTMLVKQRGVPDQYRKAIVGGFVISKTTDDENDSIGEIKGPELRKVKSWMEKRMTDMDAYLIFRQAGRPFKWEVY